MLKAIDTVYNGRRYRSRLEARWAVFFETLRIPFDYEPQPYDLGDGPEKGYSPDFWLPRQKCWIEIKGAEPGANDRRKCALLAAQSRRSVFLFAGQFYVRADDDLCWYTGEPAATHFAPDGCGGVDEDSGWCWAECLSCGTVGITYQGRMKHLPCGGCAHGKESGTYITSTTMRLVRAFQKAQKTRFENRERVA